MPRYSIGPRLTRRRDSDYWYIAWADGNGRIRRRSTGAKDIEAAKAELRRFVPECQEPIIRDCFGDEPTTIYFVQQMPNGPVKIGMTDNLGIRLESLRQQSPVPVRLLGYITAPRRTEKEMHADFADYRLNGEWFRPDPHLLGCIGDLLSRRLARN